VGISPSVSVQATLDGRILSEDEYREAIDGMSRIPCDKKCLLALEDECRCRCGGINHGKWVRGAAHDTSLDAFNSEGMPVVANNIIKGRTMLLMLAKREVVAAYGSAFGGLRG
jgi:hypothetical protein